MLEFLPQSTWTDRIGWVLIHSLWQFATAALFAIALQWTLRRRPATTRYMALLLVHAVDTTDAATAKQPIASSEPPAVVMRPKGRKWLNCFAAMDTMP
jgi:hypothetical protein